MATRRAAIYARISDDPTGQAAGVGRQKADCAKLAEQKGWDVVGVYEDNDVSAFKRNGHREQYRRLLEDMRAGVVDAVAVWHEDRLHRQPKELEEFIDIANAMGVQLATVTGDIDLGTPEGRLRARMLGNVGAYESEHRGARLRRKHEQIAAEGRVSGGGTRPFGYDDDRVTVRASEAKVVREGARRVLRGESLRSICNEWNGRGLRTSADKRWEQGALSRMLQSARISGRREHHGKIVAKASWPAIIDAEQNDRLRALLSDPDRRRNRHSQRYLLTGIVKCGRCGIRLVARPRGDKRRCYVCASGLRFDGCGKIRSLADPLEELVAGMVIVAVDSAELAREIAEETRRRTVDRHLAGSIDEDEEQLVVLAKEWAEKRISHAEWTAAREAIEQRLGARRRRLAAEQRVAALDGYVGKAGALARAWPKLNIDQRRAVIVAIVDRVEVGPAVRGRNRFDPDRVKVVWRF
jgi:site-specific DNA recombinase